MVVAPVARRKGIGRKLMQAVLQEFSRRGVPAIKLAVAADNEPANQYYLQEGFEKAGVYDSHGVLTNIYVRNL